MVLLLLKKNIEMKLKNIKGSGLSNVKKASGNRLKSIKGSGLKILK